MMLGSFGFLHFTLIDLLDILMVAVVLFIAFRWIKGSSAINIFIAVLAVLFVQIIANALGMRMISSLLKTLIDVGAIALIVIFQPEIRRFLNSIGKKVGTSFEGRFFLKKFFPGQGENSVDSKAISEIVEACQEMSDQKTGALIIIRRSVMLEDIIATGDIIDAEISHRLIMNIFYKNSPLHDGAMIIGDKRIIAARCTLPITERSNLPARYGMRHKAAIGISEQCDADVVVVSEQTGRISFVRSGEITTIDNINKLTLLLGEKTE